MNDTVNVFSQMLGKVFHTVRSNGDELVFIGDEGSYHFMHHQDCCESVYIDDITGDLNDLVGSPLLIAEEVNGKIPDVFDESLYEATQWTFYKFATINGYVDVRWFGTSNGYYSTAVDFEVLNK